MAVCFPGPVRTFWTEIISFISTVSRIPDRPVRSLVTTLSELRRLQGILNVCCEPRVQCRASSRIRWQCLVQTQTFLQRVVMGLKETDGEAQNQILGISLQVIYKSGKTGERGRESNRVFSSVMWVGRGAACGGGGGGSREAGERA